MVTVCDVNKIDSNITGLSYAEEVCLRILPTVAADGVDPTWYGLEPNSYSDFGGDLSTVARQPISNTRQRKKGTVTGKTASGGFNADVTQTNLTRLMQGFFFAKARQKPTNKPFNGTQIALTSIANADASINAASGLKQFLAGALIKVSKTSLNNGLSKVATTATGKITLTGPVVVNETPTVDALVEMVGFEFASGIMSLTAAAGGVTLAITGVAQAASTYTITSTNNFSAAETVTLNGVVYTARASVAALLTAGDFLIGVDKAASLANLSAAINAGTGAGTVYAAATVANPYATANGASPLVVTAIAGGVAGNDYTTTTTAVSGSWTSTVMAGGTGAASFLGLGLVPGEYIFVGGDTTISQFTQVSSTNRPGYARIRSVANASLVLDYTTWTPQTDAGTAKTIQLFFGTVIRNEPLPQDVVLKTYQLERTLGKDSVGTQSQYLIGAVANEFKLNIPDEDKLNADLTFIAVDDIARTGTEGLKPGARASAPGESAFNTSQDIYRIRLAVYDPANINGSPLVGFLQEADISITNNAAPVRALGYIGAIDVSVGNFEASGSITGVFSTVAAIKAIQNNADVGLSMILARANGGIVFDMPLLGLGGGRLNVALNEPITLPLDANGAQSDKGFTLLSDWFPYLPTVGMPV